MKKILVALCMVFAVLGVVPFAQALTVTDVANGASADFELSGTTLTIDLSYFSTTQTPGNANILSALFFNESAALTPVSAIMDAGATIYYQGSTTTPTAGNVGGEWRYESGISGLNSANSGISAVGLGVFGSGANFNGPDLNNQVPIDGGGYALISQGSVDGASSDGLGVDPLIHYGVTFTLTTPQDFSLTSISNVGFYYGTATITNNVPEPSMLLLLGAGLVGLVGVARRRVKK